MNSEQYLKERRIIIDNELQRLLPPSEQYPPSVHRAMHHSLFAGGKRIRPILTLAAYELFTTNYASILPTACALECIHTYSLIHDDLPAMDNDDYRRGVPTCHKVFGEAIAILAGDALLTHAFYLLAENGKSEGVNAEKVVRVISEVSSACGVGGLIGGQVVDLESENVVVDASTLSFIHNNKTGALIKVAIRAGAILAGASETKLEALTTYGENLGLAFQITDDILDIEGSIEALGKLPGSDQEKQKATFPALFGIEESKRQAKEAVINAQQSLRCFGGKAKNLQTLAEYILNRTF